MTTRPVAVIVLAAGKGTRMKSDKHKVLHPIGGLPMVGHVLKTAQALGASRSVLVVGSLKEQVEAAFGDQAAIALQEPQLGTAHAVQAAQTRLADFEGDVLILYGDVPLIRPETLAAMLERLNTPVNGVDPACVVLAFRPQDPAAYGRIVADAAGVIETMVEFKDATPEQRAITEVNPGVYLFDATVFARAQALSADNAAGEYYITDLPRFYLEAGERVETLLVDDETELLGVNDKRQLALAEAVLRERIRRRWLAEGVTMLDPATTYLDDGVELGAGVVLEQGVVLRGATRVGDGARVGAYSVLTDLEVAPGAYILPHTVRAG